ncbi:hypothetical protein QE152_g22170 [Popillia japonica]|uniref:Uncharacterized protein n=1 Tax=Popillia japonica TaxID=7064 RepID=A0AAW1KJQ7_POPJA
MEIFKRILMLFVVMLVVISTLTDANPVPDAAPHYYRDYWHSYRYPCFGWQCYPGGYRPGPLPCYGRRCGYYY